MRQAIAGQREKTVTLHNFRNNGELFYKHFTIQPLVDRQRTLVYFLGIQYDVTDQIRAGGATGAARYPSPESVATRGSRRLSTVTVSAGRKVRVMIAVPASPNSTMAPTPR